MHEKSTHRRNIRTTYPTRAGDNVDFSGRIPSCLVLFALRTRPRHRRKHSESFRRATNIFVARSENFRYIFASSTHPARNQKRTRTRERLWKNPHCHRHALVTSSGPCGRSRFLARKSGRTFSKNLILFGSDFFNS